jgi:hypothetical protein
LAARATDGAMEAWSSGVRESAAEGLTRFAIEFGWLCHGYQ